MTLRTCGLTIVRDPDLLQLCLGGRRWPTRGLILLPFSFLRIATHVHVMMRIAASIDALSMRAILISIHLAHLDAQLHIHASCASLQTRHDTSLHACLCVLYTTPIMRCISMCILTDVLFCVFSCAYMCLQTPVHVLVVSLFCLSPSIRDTVSAQACSNTTLIVVCSSGLQLVFMRIFVRSTQFLEHSLSTRMGSSGGHLSIQNNLMRHIPVFSACGF